MLALSYAQHPSVHINWGQHIVLMTTKHVPTANDPNKIQTPVRRSARVG
jgi:hypothetical protein